MSAKQADTRRRWGSLRARIGLLLVAAALPAAALDIASALKLYDSTVTLHNRNLMENAASVAQRVEDEISEAGKLARLLAALPGTSSGPGCDPALPIVVSNFPSVTAAALIRPDGSIACATGIDQDGERELLTEAAGEWEVMAFDGPRGGLSVDIDGHPGWRFAVVYPLASPIEAAMDAIPDGTRVGVVDERWRLIARAPESIPLPSLAGGELAPANLLGETATFEDEQANRFRVTVAPIEHSSLFAFAYRSEPELFAEESAVFFSSIAAPLLMILFAVSAAWVGIDRLVVRWIVYLRRITDAYGAGRTGVRSKRLDDAPPEFAALGTAFDRMAAAVGERTRAAEEQARERGLLLRELHHRIKNNFQLIASLISLQKREVEPEVAAALSTHERRVGAIAAAYRVSYAEGEIGAVGISPLLHELREIIARHEDRPWARIDLDLAPDLPAIALDRAVPAALLITKLADARIGSSGEEAVITIAARTLDGNISIEISGGTGSVDRSRLSLRLRTAVASQLGATVIEPEDGGPTSIIFPIEG